MATTALKITNDFIFRYIFSRPENSDLLLDLVLVPRYDYGIPPLDRKGSRGWPLVVILVDEGSGEKPTFDRNKRGLLPSNRNGSACSRSWKKATR